VGYVIELHEMGKFEVQTNVGWYGIEGFKKYVKIRIHWLSLNKKKGDLF
jgi:hypothetical protein